MFPAAPGVSLVNYANAGFVFTAAVLNIKTPLLFIYNHHAKSFRLSQRMVVHKYHPLGGFKHDLSKILCSLFLLAL